MNYACIYRAAQRRNMTSSDPIEPRSSGWMRPAKRNSFPVGRRKLPQLLGLQPMGTFLVDAPAQSRPRRWIEA